MNDYEGRVTVSTIQWFSLAFKSAHGRYIICYNLQKEGAHMIQRAQEGLGSADFVLEPQSSHYDDLTTHTLRKEFNAKHNQRA